MEDQRPIIVEAPAPPKPNFFERHKTVITVAATSAIWITINQIAVRQFNEFLKERDLYDEYWNDPDDLDL